MCICGAGKAFVITGVLDCMEREEAADLIKVRSPLPSEWRVESGGWKGFRAEGQQWSQGCWRRLLTSSRSFILLPTCLHT